MGLTAKYTDKKVLTWQTAAHRSQIPSRITSASAYPAWSMARRPGHRDNLGALSQVKISSAPQMNDAEIVPLRGDDPQRQEQLLMLYHQGRRAEPVPGHVVQHINKFIGLVGTVAP